MRQQRKVSVRMRFTLYFLGVKESHFLYRPVKVFFVANSSRTFKTEQGSVGGSGRAYNLSRQICIVSSKGTFVNNELTSNEHMISLLWLYVLAQSAKLKESLIVN